MTPARLAACLAAIGWTQRELGRRCGVDERQVRRWAQLGTRYQMPGELADWLEMLVRISAPIAAQIADLEEQREELFASHPAPEKKYRPVQIVA